MGTALNSVYNHYLTTYTPREVTRYDTHKKSELRGIYNSIVKLNKESPWYLPTTNKETQNYAVNVKENARALYNTIAGLGGLEEGLLNKKRAFSTNENVATATYIGSMNTESAAPWFELTVDNLATSQENLGLFLPDAPTNVLPDTYSFDVAINDMNYEFQFSIGEEESNKTVQERLARLINNSGIGIKASLVEEEGRTALKLTSDSTGLPAGKESIFRISDSHTSKRAGTVAYFGLDYTSRPATNATFRVNGEEHTSSSNSFTLGKLYEVELQGTTTEEDDTIRIGLKPDVESLTDNITNLINGYNEFIKASSAYLESQARSKRLLQEMKDIASLYQSSLESTGMTIEQDGTMSIDDALLAQTASESENVTETFNYLKDFSNLLLRKSNNISLNPMDYVDRTIVAYKNPGHNFTSPYATSAYSGMMFNGYC